MTAEAKLCAAEPATVQPSPCRFCGAPLTESFVDLGVSPPANYYLAETDLRRMEAFFPLHAFVCGSCFLVQLEQFQTPEQLFGHYSYFSSVSESWLKHADSYAQMVAGRFGLGAKSQVVEVASNDGYLLQFFQRRGIPVLGVEPAANVARAAEQKGVPTLVRFFGVETARAVVLMGKQADLLVGNNVLAHVPDLNGFVAGLEIALKPDGVLTMEFPHLLKLIALNQFDTVYHEHFSYFSLLAVERVFASHGLRLFDVEELPTHGGSLRIYACHKASSRETGVRLAAVRQAEREAGLDKIETYRGFVEKVRATKRDLLEFLISAKQAGRSVAGYGAPAKGNTLLNYCGIGTDFLDYTVDKSPHKQGLYLPGSRIPIFSPDKVRETKPDYLLILPWNLKDEIIEQMAFIRQWRGRFVIPIPQVTVLP
ncbi:MAG: class I SAM-dependent methyltransferase [Alphaproteobacteria bacterium]